MKYSENSTDRRLVLNVGGNNKEIPIPNYFDGWEHLLLDIDPDVKPDIVCDARKLDTLKSGTFDAIYCSHNLEHYHRHDAYKVLAGFRHVLKEDGFCEIAVPDIQEVMRLTIQNNLDIDDVLYTAPAGPILVRDVIYGWGKEIERSGNDFFSHKTGFTKKSLIKLLGEAGFPIIYAGSANIEIRALAFKQRPSSFHQKLIGISPPPD